MSCHDVKLSDENLAWLRQVESNMQAYQNQNSHEIKLKAAGVQSLVNRCLKGEASIIEVSSALEEFARTHTGIIV